MNSLFTSSKTSEWATPDWLYKQLDDEFHFQLDTACTPDNCKCKFGWGLIDYHSVNYANKDSTVNEWYGYTDCGIPIKSIWCNPPYNDLEKWIKKGYEASQHGCTVVFLLPTTKTDQPWWHEIVLKHASDIRFIERRVKFGGAKSAAPFPSVVVIFKPAERDWKYKSIRKIKGV